MVVGGGGGGGEGRNTFDFDGFTVLSLELFDKTPPALKGHQTKPKQKDNS